MWAFSGISFQPKKKEAVNPPPSPTPKETNHPLTTIDDRKPPLPPPSCPHKHRRERVLEISCLNGAQPRHARVPVGLLHDGVRRVRGRRRHAAGRGGTAAREAPAGGTKGGDLVGGHWFGGYEVVGKWGVGYWFGGWGVLEGKKQNFLEKKVGTERVLATCNNSSDPKSTEGKFTTSAPLILSFSSS